MDNLTGNSKSTRNSNENLKLIIMKGFDESNNRLYYFYQLLTHFISFNFSKSIKKIFLLNNIKNDYNFINKINGLDLNDNNDIIIIKL